MSFLVLGVHNRVGSAVHFGLFAFLSSPYQVADTDAEGDQQEAADQQGDAGLRDEPCRREIFNPVFNHNSKS